MKIRFGLYGKQSEFRISKTHKWSNGNYTVQLMNQNEDAKPNVLEVTMTRHHVTELLAEMDKTDAETRR